MSENEIRWYKGKWQVRIIKKSNVDVKGKHLIRNMEVEALERIRLTLKHQGVEMSAIIVKGDTFTTVPRLLWRHPRENHG